MREREKSKKGLGPGTARDAARCLIAMRGARGEEKRKGTKGKLGGRESIRLDL